MALPTTKGFPHQLQATIITTMANGVIIQSPTYTADDSENVMEIITYLQTSGSCPTKMVLPYFCENFCEELYLMTRPELQESFKRRLIYVLRTTESINLKNTITCILMSINNIDNYLNGEYYNDDVPIINIGDYKEIMVQYNTLREEMMAQYNSITE